MSLEQDLLRERLAAFVRLKGGYPVPLAGAVYWLGLAALGLFATGKTWTIWAFITSGAIFPLALLFAAITRVNFMKDKTAVSSVLFPAFVSMFLFWPMAVAAFWDAVHIAPLILAIGMSIHWPVIGWSYGRTAIYTGHALVRAVAVFAIWIAFPDQRYTLLPLAVAVVYLLTVAVILIDAGRLAKRAELATSAG
jgi:hypothetical protein